jgi:hypothetical protein
VTTVFRGKAKKRAKWRRAMGMTFELDIVARRSCFAGRDGHGRAQQAAEDGRYELFDF